MRLCIFYRLHSEHARPVEEFAHEFQRLHTARVELENVEMRTGSDAANLYDIFQFPSILVLRDDGQMVQMWSGQPLPLMDEVAAYFQ